MGSKKDAYEVEIVRQMQKVITCIQSKNKSVDDLFNVMYRFTVKDYEHHKEVAKEWGVAPVNLLLTALLYFFHPLVVDEEGYTRGGYISMHAKIVEAQLWDWDLAVMVKPIQSPMPVDNFSNRIDLPVDRKGN